MVGNGNEWLGMAGNGREWQGMAGNGREWQEMAGNGWECPNRFSPFAIGDIYHNMCINKSDEG
jgi:hypothetical protein